SEAGSGFCDRRLREVAVRRAGGRLSLRAKRLDRRVPSFDDRLGFLQTPGLLLFLRSGFPRLSAPLHWRARLGASAVFGEGGLSSHPAGGCRGSARKIPTPNPIAD